MRVPRHAIREVYAKEGRVFIRAVGVLGSGVSSLALADQDVAHMAGRWVQDAERAAVVIRGLPFVEVSNIRTRDRKEERRTKREARLMGRDIGKLTVEFQDGVKVPVETSLKALDAFAADGSAWGGDYKTVEETKLELLAPESLFQARKVGDKTLPVRRREFLDRLREAYAMAEIGLDVSFRRVDWAEK